MAPAGTAVSALPVVPAAPEEMPIKIILLGATPPGAMVVPAATAASVPRLTLVAPAALGAAGVAAGYCSARAAPMRM
ncbi:Uncharacterised protein [Mycobacterium tuberculosis]|nr:Uncharacterised protein [Mycobacterium tuberculosis]